MKKLLIITLAGLLVLALSVAVFAATNAVPEEDAKPVILNAGFHCNANGGNGRVWVDLYDERFEADKAKKKDGVGGVLEALIDLGDNCWLLASDEYFCPACGNNEWVSYSNKSGVPNGKNIQLTHQTVNHCD